MIPRIFHRLWVGGPMPDELAGYGETWGRHHPGWEHRFWHEGNLPELRNQALYDAAEEIAPSNVGQFRADVARYELLYQFGGVWVDCDFECLRPIDGLLDGVGAFAAWEVDQVWVNNAILGATAGHPFLESLIRRLPGNVQRHRGSRPNKLTGPQFLTAIWRAMHNDVRIFPKELFYGYLYSDIGTSREGFVAPGAYASHHWHNRRTQLAAR